jgi:hypothetical protein
MMSEFNGRVEVILRLSVWCWAVFGAVEVARAQWGAALTVLLCGTLTLIVWREWRRHL